MKQGIRWHVLEQAGWNFHHVRYVPKNVGMLMTRGTLHVEYRINTKDLFSMEEIHERVLWVAEQVHLATVGCSQIPNLD